MRGTKAKTVEMSYFLHQAGPDCIPVFYFMLLTKLTILFNTVLEFVKKLA